MSSRLRFSAPLRVLAVLAIPLITTPIVTAKAAAPPVTSRAASQVTMTVQPKVFTGGQMISYSGNVGAPDVVVTLQGSQRPGAPWSRLARTRSAADGSYELRQPAPSMRGIQRRVVAGGAASDAVRMYAQSQDLVLVPLGTPVAGQPLDLEVSTVPGPHWPRTSPFFVKGRPDLPAPIFEGRQLTLEQRTADGAWQLVEGVTDTVDGRGHGVLTVPEPEAGTVTYRAVQENFPQAGGPAIGWFPSFPTPVHVAAMTGSATTYNRPTTLTPESSTASVTATPASAADDPVAATERGALSGAGAVTGQQRYGWGGALWDFGLPAGQSLTSPPSRGELKQGWWSDGSDGTGRANQHNGGISLNSQRYAPAKDEDENAGDRGSTWITLRGIARAYGRWETRVRLRPYESGARDYRAVVELVPDAHSAEECVGDQIVVADLAAHSTTVRFGASSADTGRRWSATRAVGDV
jgi:hypothetical protein